MNTILSPDRSIVERGKLLNILIHGDEKRLSHRQFIVMQDFDYGECLEEIRTKTSIKSEDVFSRLCDVLLERGIVIAVESCILDIGQLGRPSEALKEYYKHKLNSNFGYVKTLIREIEKGHFTIMTPEGEVHLLKVSKGETLAQVNVSIDDANGIVETARLDLIGPMDLDIPGDIHESIKEELLHHLRENHPDLDVQLNVRVSQSELAAAHRCLYG